MVGERKRRGEGDVESMGNPAKRLREEPYRNGTVGVVEELCGRVLDYYNFK